MQIFTGINTVIKQISELHNVHKGRTEIYKLISQAASVIQQWNIRDCEVHLKIYLIVRVHLKICVIVKVHLKIYVLCSACSGGITVK